MKNILPIMLLLLTAGCRPTSPAADSSLPPDTAPPGPLARQHPDDLRLVTFNVYMDSVFVAGADAAQRFARLVKALDADIWAYK